MMDELTLDEIEVMLPKARADGRQEDVDFLLTELDRIEANEVSGQPEPVVKPKTLSEQNNEAIQNLGNKVIKPVELSRNEKIQQINDLSQENKIKTVDEDGIVQDMGNTSKNIMKLFAKTSDIADSATDLVDDAIDVASVVGSGLTELPARAVAGLSGLGTIAATKIGNIFGLTDADALDVGVRTVNSIKDNLTIDATEDATDAVQSGAETAMKLLKPVLETAPAEWLSDKVANQDEFVEGFGDIGVSLLGEEFRAEAKTAAKTFHELFKLSGEILLPGIGKGIKTVGKSAIDNRKVSKEIDKEIKDFSIDSNKMKDIVSKQFKDIRDKNITLNNNQVSEFKSDLINNLKDITIGKGVSPASRDIIQRINNKIKSEEPINIVDFQSFRSELGKVSRGANPTDAGVADRTISALDKTLDKIEDVDFRTARKNDLKRRKVKQIEAAIDTAELTLDADDTTTFARAIKTPIKGMIRKDINKASKDQKTQFNKKETEVIQKISRANDTTIEAFYNLVGRMNPKGIEKGKTTLLGLIPGTGLIGEIADNALDTIKRKKSIAAKNIIAAGDNADDIVKAYLKNTPRKEQSVEELTALLLRDGVKDFNSVKFINKNVKEATINAKNIKEVLDAFSDSSTGSKVATVSALEGLDEILQERPAFNDGKGTSIEIKKQKDNK